VNGKGKGKDECNDEDVDDGDRWIFIQRWHMNMEWMEDGIKKKDFSQKSKVESRNKKNNCI
jgi:hypothetical protein